MVNLNILHSMYLGTEKNTKLKFTKLETLRSLSFLFLFFMLSISAHSQHKCEHFSFQDISTTAPTSQQVSELHQWQNEIQNSFESFVGDFPKFNKPGGLGFKACAEISQFGAISITMQDGFAAFIPSNSWNDYENHYPKECAYRFIECIIAHEIAHTFQFKIGRLEHFNTPQKELHADFMAGALQRMCDNSKVRNSTYDYKSKRLLSAARDWMESLGDNYFDDPEHHGTNLERQHAYWLGYRHKLKYDYEFVTKASTYSGKTKWISSPLDKMKRQKQTPYIRNKKTMQVSTLYEHFYFEGIKYVEVQFSHKNQR